VIRTLLIDDEELARERLRQLLRQHADVEVVGEAADGEEALEKILDLRPDLILLDIQMPGCSGMEVVESLPSPRPHVIFCTAFDQYAIDAFELHAVDYLLKPVTRARLAKAIERVRGVPTPEADETLTKLSRVPRKESRRFLAKRGNKYRVVAENEVYLFSTEEGLTKLCTRDQEYWMQPTLSDLENRLDPSSFFRVSRGAIVNLNVIEELQQLVGGYGAVVLKNGARVEVSRRRMKDLFELLGGH
jgi:two-component system LytT family response regulator